MVLRHVLIQQRHTGNVDCACADVNRQQTHTLTLSPPSLAEIQEAAGWGLTDNSQIWTPI